VQCNRCWRRSQVTSDVTVTSCNVAWQLLLGPTATWGQTDDNHDVRPCLHYTETSLQSIKADELTLHINLLEHSELNVLLTVHHSISV
jgi:hypothetical protein